MKFLGLALIGVTVGLDDTTLGLLARVDPLPVSGGGSVTGGFVELGDHLPDHHFYDESSVPFSGIQVEDPTRLLSGKLPSPLPPQTDRRSIHVARRVHLHDAPVPAGEAPPVEPDVYLCPLLSGNNGLSSRNCDAVTSTSRAVLNQVLSCSQAITPDVVASMMMGGQTSPVDFTNPHSVLNDLRNMATNMTLQVSLSVPCSGDKSLMPSMELKNNYVAFVMVSGDVRLASDNLGVNFKPAMSSGIVFVDVGVLSNSAEYRQFLATQFTDNVKTCRSDGICPAAELVQWVPSGTNWIIGNSKNRLRLLSENGVVISGR
jgi:hypothetical protein